MVSISIEKEKRVKNSSPFEAFLLLLRAGLGIFDSSVAGALLLSSLNFFGDVTSGSTLGLLMS